MPATKLSGSEDACTFFTFSSASSSWDRVKSLLKALMFCWSSKLTSGPPLPCLQPCSSLLGSSTSAAASGWVPWLLMFRLIVD